MSPNTACLDWHCLIEPAGPRFAAIPRRSSAIKNNGQPIGPIKRALDIGADGVVVPWVETADQLRQAVAFAHYPPAGLRGMGGERATCWGKCLSEHANEADEDAVPLVPIIENGCSRGSKPSSEMCHVDEITNTAFHVGPARSIRRRPASRDYGRAGVRRQPVAIKDTIRLALGKLVHGVLATSNDNLAERRDQGFRFLGIGMDAGLLLGVQADGRRHGNGSWDVNLNIADA